MDVLVSATGGDGRGGGENGRFADGKSRERLGAGGADSQRLSETEADEKMNGSKVVESIDSSGADHETETEPDTALPYVSAFSNSAIPPRWQSFRQAPQVLPWADMKDFNFLLNEYFILGRLPRRSTNPSLNVDNLMERDLAIDTATDGPQYPDLPYPLPGGLRRFQARGSSAIRSSAWGSA